MNRVHVVAGIIWNNNKTEILISQRPQHLHKGGYWEFPGGKVESSEAEVEALSRELYEELNIRFQQTEKFQQIDFDYVDKSVRLDFYHVYGVSGEIKANEGQEFRWVTLPELTQYKFPQANLPVVESLLLLI